MYQLLGLVKNNSLIEKGNSEINRWKKVNDKVGLDSLLLDFCLVRTKYLFLTVSPFLFYHCPKETVLLLFPTQISRLSVLNMFLHIEKSVGWSSMAKTTSCSFAWHKQN